MKVLESAEKELMSAMSNHSDYDEIGALLEVAKLLKAIRDTRGYGRTPAGTFGGPETADGMFRFEVEADVLSRIGRKADGSVYQQQIERPVFERIVGEIARMANTGTRRVKATEVHSAIPDVPYYQVNASVSFLKTAKVLEKLAEGPESIRLGAERAWEAARKK